MPPSPRTKDLGQSNREDAAGGVLGSLVFSRVLHVSVSVLCACPPSPAPRTHGAPLTPHAHRYVGLCINMTVGIFSGKTAYYLALLWTGSMASFFMVSKRSGQRNCYIGRVYVQTSLYLLELAHFLVGCLDHRNLRTPPGPTC